MKSSRFFRALRIIRMRRPGYFVYLITGYLIPNLSYHLFRLLPPNPLKRLLGLGFVFVLMVLWISLASIWNWQTASIIMIVIFGVIIITYSIYRYLTLKSNIRLASKLMEIASPSAFTTWSNFPVDSDVRQAVEQHQQEHAEDELVLGQVDNDGRLYGKFGPLPNWTIVSQEEFVPRYHYPLDVVLYNGHVLIRKDFQGDRVRFVQEWFNLLKLMGKANVPAVYRADEKRTFLYKNLLLARTLRDVLVESGTKILTVDTDSDPDLVGRSKFDRLNTILARGTRQVNTCFSSSFFNLLEQQIDAVHKEGITGLSLTFGNVMVDDQEVPWLIDFEGAQHYSAPNNLLFQWSRDQDRIKYNQIYGQNVITENIARVEISNSLKTSPGWYAPVDFGGGLAINGFLTVESGTGRWEVLNSKVLKPHIAGKRILDLGSNNGVMPLLMLRDGAKEVIGFEYDASYIKRAAIIQKIFEWRHMCRYNLSIYQKDMRAILEEEWGIFDIITAFCSLYYLSEIDMARVVRRSSMMAPKMVLQANVDTRTEANANKSSKSSLLFLKKLLEMNGYPHVEIIAPTGYSRPILIGERTE